MRHFPIPGSFVLELPGPFAGLIHFCTVLGIASSLLLLPGDAAWALPPERDEADLWVPSADVGLGLTFSRVGASLSSGPVTGNQFIGVPQPLQPATAGSSVMATPFVNVGLEIMTPRLTRDWGMPRFFAHGNVAYAFGSTFDTAKTGLPGPFEVAPAISRPFLLESVILGQGATSSGRVQPLQVSAGVGVAFSFDLWDVRIRIKPSLEYLREEFKITGTLNRAVQVIPNPPLLSDFRFIRYKQSRDRVFHSIGPGLQIEADVARLGPIVLAPFMGGQAVYSLTSRRVNLDQSEIPPCSPGLGCTPPAAAETANWSWKKNPWTYRVNAGIRLRFAPK